MKNTALLTFFLTIICMGSVQSLYSETYINPLIGDVSYVNQFGKNPDKNTDEDLRIKTHLLYVSNLLTQKDVSNLPVLLKVRRKYIIQLLHKYIEAGIFPRNYEHKNKRVPCFIDEGGKICAVGYLIEQTAGREVAEAINQTHKYDKILDMNDPVVSMWIKHSGLTKEECAMIQPTYGWGPPPEPTSHITPAYGISSSILGATNLSFMTINSIQISKGTNSKVVPIIGMVTGIAQLSLGSALYPSEQYDLNGNYITNEGQKTLSMVNIGVGASTIILSTWNLVANWKNKNKAKPTTWNLYSYPANNNSIGIGFYFSYKF